MELNWGKCTNGTWCNLLNLETNHEVFNNMVGVYIIWSEKSRLAIKIGSGNIRERLVEHQNNNDIIKYTELKVTWAPVLGVYMHGVEVFLGKRYSPIIGERFPDVEPIPVNLPLL